MAKNRTEANTRIFPTFNVFEAILPIKNCKEFCRASFILPRQYEFFCPILGRPRLQGVKKVGTEDESLSSQAKLRVLTGYQTTPPPSPYVELKSVVFCQRGLMY